VHGAHLGVDLGTRTGQKGRSASGSSAPGGGSHWSLGSDEVKARSGLKAALALRDVGMTEIPDVVRRQPR
jgi:hypothetical protein